MAAAKKLPSFRELMEPDLKKVYLAEQEAYERRRAMLLAFQQDMVRQAREAAERAAYEALRQFPEFEGEEMPADGLDPIYLAEDAIKIRETEKAIMVAFDVITDFWIPKSALHPLTNLNGPKGKLVVRKWFAQKAGLL